MSSIEDDYLAPRGIASAMALGIIGALTIWIVPGLIGLFADQAPLDDRHLGYVAAWEINSMAVTIGITALIMRRVNWRMLALLALALMVGGNLCTALTHSFGPIVAVRVLAGAGEGIAVGISFAALGRSRNPNRIFAIYLVAGSVLSAAILAFLPALSAYFGSSLLFVGIALMAAVVALGVPWFPVGGSTDRSPMPGKSSVDIRLAAISLIGVFLYFLAQGAMWSYFELIGHANNIDAVQISRALAVATLAGIGGALLAAALPTRLGRAWPLVMSGVLSTFSFLLLKGHVAAPIFLMAGVLLMFAWQLSQPLLSGLCCEADGEGRIVCAMGCVQTIGVGLGPAVAALLLSNQNFAPVIWMSSAVLVVSVAIVLTGILGSRGAAPVPLT
jgi:DHA1 family inner membrane transport protein